MIKTIQYQTISYKSFLWWYVALVHHWEIDSETKIKISGTLVIKGYWFFRSRQPDFVRDYIAKDMKKRNTKLRWEQRFLKAKDA